MINKPIGFVSAQAEKDYKPAMTLLTKENEFKSEPKITRTSSNDRINIRKPAFAMKKIDPQALEGLAVIGRLDIDSTGLLIFTQDGRLAKQVIGEDTLIEKVFLILKVK